LANLGHISVEEQAEINKLVKVENEPDLQDVNLRPEDIGFALTSQTTEDAKTLALWLFAHSKLHAASNWKELYPKLKELADKSTHPAAKLALAKLTQA